MIIDLVEGAPELQCTLRSAIKGRTVVATELARLESRIGALRRGQVDHLETYRQFFDGSDMQPMDREVFDLATELRVRHRIKTPDALHLAAAIHSSCAELWTNDKRLASAAQGRIRIVDWDDLIPPTETVGQ
jgi:predicted nucleic acid-binding protein